jgi:hypothetical protein
MFFAGDFFRFRYLGHPIPVLSRPVFISRSADISCLRVRRGCAADAFARPLISARPMFLENARPICHISASDFSASGICVCNSAADVGVFAAGICAAGVCICAADIWASATGNCICATNILVFRDIFMNMRRATGNVDVFARPLFSFPVVARPVS